MVLNIFTRECNIMEELEVMKITDTDKLTNL